MLIHKSYMYFISMQDRINLNIMDLVGMNIYVGVCRHSRDFESG